MRAKLRHFLKSLLSSILLKSRTEVTGAGGGGNSRSNCDSGVLSGFRTSARLCQHLGRQALLSFQVAVRTGHRYGSRSWLMALQRQFLDSLLHQTAKMMVLSMLLPSACPL